MIMCRFLHKFDTSNWYIKADFFQSSPAGRIIDPFNNWIPVHVMILQFPLQCQINSIVAKYTKAWDKRNWKEFKRQIEKDLTFVKFKTRETALRGTLGFSVLWCFSCGISVILPLRYGILFYPFEQFRYSLNFRRGTAVFHDFPPGIAVQSTPQCPPPHSTCTRRHREHFNQFNICKGMRAPPGKFLKLRSLN